MKSVQIRLAEIHDFDAIQPIMADVHNLHVQFRPDLYKPTEKGLSMEDFKENLATSTLYVATLDSKVVGVVSFVREHTESTKAYTRDIMYMDCLGVHPDYRGQGIGTALLTFMQALAKKEHMDALELRVNSKNKEAKRLYERLGFQDKYTYMEYI